jgi:adenylate cyclase
VIRAIRRLAATRTLRALGPTKIRLVSGLTLFTYVGCHLTNHALGNLSVGAMEAGLIVQKFIWQGLIGTAALYLALTTHFFLGLWALYQRRHYGWRRAEVAQLILGLSIPFLLAHHLIVTRFDYSLFGTTKGYAQELYSFWVAAPFWGVVQVVLLIVVWIHGCIGIYHWLRLKPVFRRIAPVLFAIAILLPVLALLGFFQGGRAIRAMAGQPAWRDTNLGVRQIGTAGENAWLEWLHQGTLVSIGVLIIVALAARGIRGLRERVAGSIRLFYPHGRIVRVPRGFSILEASLMARVPHACICGGRARCSTCRVRILGDRTDLPVPSETERSVLRRIHAGPSVRLACQLRPLTDTAVVPLLPATLSIANMYGHAIHLGGEERFVAILMVDMRDSTQLAARRLPFDAVFAVGNFIDAVSRAVVSAGGLPNQFLGDGLLAIFGLDCDAREACRRALTAVCAIAASVEAVNRVFHREWAEPIAFSIGVHGGEAVVGEVAYAGMAVFTALGNPANFAARMQQHCRTFDCEAVISEDIFALAAIAIDDLPRRIIDLRGIDYPVPVRIVSRVAELARQLPARPVS